MIIMVRVSLQFEVCDKRALFNILLYAFTKKVSAVAFY